MEIRARPGVVAPLARQCLDQLKGFGSGTPNTVRYARLFLIEPSLQGDADRSTIERIASSLLSDPVTDCWRLWPAGEPQPDPPDGLAVEVYPLPGVMDPVADSTRAALAEMGLAVESVRTGHRYELVPAPGRGELPLVLRLLGNACIEEVVVGARPIQPPPRPPVYQFRLRRVEIRGLSPESLAELSRRAHLFLSPVEMRAIQSFYEQMGRDPTDLELETLAQTWSEHCVHKTLRSAVRYRGLPMPVLGGEGGDEPGAVEAAPPRRAAGPLVELRYESLLRDTIMRATEGLIREGRGPECLSVFRDNAGVIGFDERFGIAFKVETHNHPSAIEPYGGAATGVGGVIRDVLGCGLGAQPIANTDVFCVAPPEWPVDAVPAGAIHPRMVLKGVVAGVRDYGNRMGIPTVNGAVQFDPRYLGNPLVYCGCVGLLPRNRLEKALQPGDAIVLVGGRTGRDGIHGATFSSSELSDGHADEFSHAVQIGNAIEQKKLLDVLLQARDYPAGRLERSKAGGEGAGTRCLFSAITDCGAGGLSSAVGEMAAGFGAEVDLEKVPLKYAGLRYDEIWISEAQERMVLAVPQEHVAPLVALAAGEDVEATVIGRFTGSGRLVVRYQGSEVGDLDLHFLHEGLPRVERLAEWPGPPAPARRRWGRAGPAGDLAGELKRRLSDPNVASKHWLIRQYDHEVGGRSVGKPLAGRHDGPSDAAVIRPRPDSYRGIAIGCGLAAHLADVDPYWMAVAAIDEALRNVVCVGGDPERTAILDNFCWPRGDDPVALGALVRACQGCHDAAAAYGVPFISGKDSLNNEFALEAGDVARVRSAVEELGAEPPGEMIRDGRIVIPYTLLISAVAIVEDVRRCVTSTLKQEGSVVFVVGRSGDGTGGGSASCPAFDVGRARATHRVVAEMIRRGVVGAVHDVSDGGVLVALAEMAMGSGRSCRVRSPVEALDAPDARRNAWFEPWAGCYLAEVVPGREAEFEELARGVPVSRLAETASTPPEDGKRMPPPPEPARLNVPTGREIVPGNLWIETAAGWQCLSLDTLAGAWKAPLDW